MPVQLRCLIFLLGVIGACLGAIPVRADSVRVGGTGTATALLDHLGAAFAGEGPHEVIVVPSLGSGGALRALADGVLDMAVSARSLKPEEIARGLRVGLTLQTPFVIATSHPDPKGLDVAGLIEAYRSPQAVWHDGSPLRVILRPRAESDTTLMGRLFPGLDAAIEAARARPDVPVAATDQDNADMAEEVPGSLIGSTLVQIELEKRRLRIVPIGGALPTAASLERGVYPYAKTLYFVTRSEPGAATTRFLAFLGSPEGRAKLRSAHVF